jgi:hypothetical protein
LFINFHVSLYSFNSLLLFLPIGPLHTNQIHARRAHLTGHILLINLEQIHINGYDPLQFIPLLLHLLKQKALFLKQTPVDIDKIADQGPGLELILFPRRLNIGLDGFLALLMASLDHLLLDLAGDLLDLVLLAATEQSVRVQDFRFWSADLVEAVHVELAHERLEIRVLEEGREDRLRKGLDIVHDESIPLWVPADYWAVFVALG